MLFFEFVPNCLGPFKLVQSDLSWSAFFSVQVNLDTWGGDIFNVDFVFVFNYLTNVIEINCNNLSNRFPFLFFS